LTSTPVNAPADCRCKIRRAKIKNKTINGIFYYFHVKGDRNPKQGRAQSGSIRHHNFENFVAARFRRQAKTRTKHERKIGKTMYMGGVLPERCVLAEIEKFTFSINSNFDHTFVAVTLLAQTGNGGVTSSQITTLSAVTARTFSART